MRSLPTFHAAAAQAVRDLTTGDLDGEHVPGALQLAVYAWQRCHPPAGARARWDLFGIDLSMACDQLPTPSRPTVVCVAEDTLPDTDQLRRMVAALTAAVAERLDDAAANPHTDPDQRWAWSIAAARLRDATDDLTGRT